MAPLKHLSALPISNGVGEAAEFDDPTWPRYVRTTDIAGPRDLRPDTFKSLPPEVARRASLQHGDIVMTAAGATIGKSLLYRATDEACYAGYLVRFRPTKLVDGRFVAYWMESRHYWDQIATGKVVSTIENFSAGKYQNLSCPSPSEAEQRAIADYLDTETARIDALIAKKQRMIELLESRFASAVMEALFPDTEHTRQLPPRNRPQKVLDYHLRATPKHWRITPFRRIGTLASGLNSDGSCELVSLTIQGETVPRTADRQPPSDEYLLRYNRICPGQLVVNPMWLVGGSIGVSTRAGAVSPDYRVYELSPDVLPEFIHHLLRSPAYREQYGLLVRAETTFDRRVTKDDFHELLLPLPPLEEQQMLCRRLSMEWDRISRIMPDLSRQIELLRERRQALITAAVTGELEVPGVAA